MRARSARQDEAFHRHYENEHTWEMLQEDEQGLLRVVRTRAYVRHTGARACAASCAWGAAPACCSAPRTHAHVRTRTRPCLPLQDRTSELRAKRRRTLLSSAQSARVRKGMIRYMLLVGRRACLHARGARVRACPTVLI